MFKIMIDSGHIGPTYNAGAVKGYYESAIVWALHKSWLQSLRNIIVRLMQQGHPSTQTWMFIREA